MNYPFLSKRRCTVFRGGTTVTELVVAATLLASVIGVVAPLTVGTGRIWNSARQYRLVVEELSNQLDRLSVMEAGEREAALADLQPSEEVRETLHDASLEGKILRDQDGTRLHLALNWERPAGATPVTLVGWIDALPAVSGDAADSGDAAPESSDDQEAP